MSDVLISSPEELIEKLKSALKKGGDFPASAKIINEINELVSNPRTTANQLSEIILRDPTLGVRILHIVNSSFYKRAKPIMTVSQAVLQLGMKPLAEICSNLILLQRLIPKARQSGSFASSLKQSIVTSLLSTSLSSRLYLDINSSKNETGYLFGLLSELGKLLLAYYFPEIYESASKRSEAKNIDFSEALNQITGITEAKLNIMLIKELGLPEFYADVIGYAEDAKKNKLTSADQRNPSIKAAISLSASKNLSEAISTDRLFDKLEQKVLLVKNQLNIEQKVLEDVLGNISQHFKDYCSSIELSLAPLPEYLSYYNKDKSDRDVEDNLNTSKNNSNKKENSDNYSEYISEIRQSVESREPTSTVITSVMEALSWGLEFDRVLLLLVSSGKKSLQGRMALGKIDNLEPSKFIRQLSQSDPSKSPEATAFYESKAVFEGIPLLQHATQFVAIPIGFNKRTVGVIYADKISRNKEISNKQKAAIGVLTELLDRSIVMHQG